MLDTYKILGDYWGVSVTRQEIPCSRPLFLSKPHESLIKIVLTSSLSGEGFLLKVGYFSFGSQVSASVREYRSKAVALAMFDSIACDFQSII